MKKLSSLYVLLCFSACSQHYPEIKPGSVQILKNRDNFTALYSVPAEYDPQRSWPLFVALHGHGDVAPAFHDLWKSPADSMGVVLLTPQGTESAPPGFGWTLTGSHSEMFLRNSIDEVRGRMNIDPNRIYIGGFSAGGSLAYYMALKYSHVFSGVIALSATCEKEWMKLPLLRERPARRRVYIGHGELEPNVAEADSTKSLFQRRGSEVRMTIYKNIGHGLPEPKRDELVRALGFILGK